MAASFWDASPPPAGKRVPGNPRHCSVRSGRGSRGSQCRSPHAGSLRHTQPGFPRLVALQLSRRGVVIYCVRARGRATLVADSSWNMQRTIICAANAGPRRGQADTRRAAALFVARRVPSGPRRHQAYCVRRLVSGPPAPQNCALRVGRACVQSGHEHEPEWLPSASVCSGGTPSHFRIRTIIQRRS
jgi:hypothetical protein